MNNTRDTIINAGIGIFLEKGYNGAGLKEILDAANVPKGSFYHFFKNKEAFGKEALNYYSEQFTPVLQQFFVESKLSPLARFEAFFTAMTELFNTEKNCKGGCLVGNLAQELADVNDELRQCILQIMQSWSRYFKNNLDAAVKAGELANDTDTQALAEFILNSWEGALLKMKIVESVAPLETFQQQISKILSCYQ